MESSASIPGTPFWISAPATSLNAPGSPQLADQVKPHVQIYGAHGLASPYFDTSAFAPVTLARFGTSNFDSFRGPGYRNVDFGLFRTFEIQERLKAQIPGGGPQCCKSSKFRQS